MFENNFTNLLFYLQIAKHQYRIERLHAASKESKRRSQERFDDMERRVTALEVTVTLAAIPDAQKEKSSTLGDPVT